MFYIKEKLSDGVTINANITTDNVYCHCPLCGKELQVNLDNVFAEGEVDLCGTNVVCDECTESIIRRR